MKEEGARSIGKRYRMGKSLGTGGSGEVWECIDETGRRHAVKKLHADFSPVMEIRALARLKHDNIVRLIDHFQEGRNYFIVMELVRGVPLSRHLERAGAPGDPARKKAILRLLPQMVNALDYLHGRGVVHGDLKPQNILVSREGTVKITDFGLSRIGFDPDRRQDVFAGTVHYASPEQCRGQAPDFRSDLYSLGVVLYEMLSGRLPFAGKELFDVLMQQISARPPSLLLISPGLEPFFEELVSWLMEKKPRDRPLSIREFWKRVCHHLPGLKAAWAPAAERGSRRIHPPAFTGRHVAFEKLEKILDAAQPGGMQVVWVRGEHGAGKTRFLREFRFRKSWEDIAFFFFSGGKHASDAPSDFLRVLAEQAPGARDGDSGVTAKALTRRLNTLGKTTTLVIVLDDYHRFAGRVLTSLKRILDGVNRKKVLICTLPDDVSFNPESHIQWQGDTEEILLKGLPPGDFHALVCSMLGTRDVSRKLLDELYRVSGGNPGFAQEILRTLQESGTLKIIDAMWDFHGKPTVFASDSLYHVIMTRLNKLDTAAREVMNALAVAYPETDCSVISAVTGFPEDALLDIAGKLEAGGFIDFHGRRFVFRHGIVQEIVSREMRPEWKREMHDAVADALRRIHPDRPLSVARHFFLGKVPAQSSPFFIMAIETFLAHGRYADAIDAAETLLQAPDTSRVHRMKALNALGISQRALGKLERSRESYARLYELASRERHRKMQMEALYGLAGVLFSIGETSAALERFLQAAELSSAAGDTRMKARCLMGAGVCYLGAGRLDEAGAAAREAAGIFGGEDSGMGLARCLQLLGDIAHEMGRYTRAERYNRKAADIFKTSGKTEHQAACIASIARAKIERGQLPEAETLLQQSIQTATAQKHPVLAAIAMINLGVLLNLKGEPRKAIRVIEQALTTARAVGYPRVIADALNALGTSREIIGDIRQAEKDFSHALEIYVRQKDEKGAAACHLSICRSRLARGNLSRARTALAQAREFIMRLPDASLSAEFSECLGKLEASTGDDASAVGHFTSALIQYEKQQRTFREGVVWCELGFLKIDAGDLREGETCFRKSLARFKSCGVKAERLQALRGLYEIHFHRGETEKQRETRNTIRRLAERLDQYFIISHVFFRLDTPVMKTPLGSKGVEIAHRIVKAPEFHDTSQKMFALTTLGSHSSGKDREARFREAASLAENLGFSGVAHRIHHLLEPPPPAGPRERHHTKGAVGMLDIMDMSPIRELLRKTREMFQAEDLDKLLTSVLDQVISATGAERGFLMTRDRRKEFTFRISRNIHKEDIEEPRFEVSRSIIRRVAETGETFFSEDALAHSDLKDRKSIQALKLRSVICIPLKTSPPSLDVFGLIYVDSSLEKGLFSPTDKLLVTIVAELASIALENMRKHQRLTETQRALSAENIRLRTQLQARYSLEGMVVGRSSAMTSVYRVLQQVSRTNVSVLITGDTGTGKELIARVIHYGSPRKDKPFVAVNCAALPENLLEAELFGIERGVATGVDARKGLIEQADNGTLFLDEIADMSPVTQAKILRVLQEREITPIGGRRARKIDIRIISATNKNLRDEIEKGTFRKDLFFRLNVINIQIPPLAARREDIPFLADHFLKKFADMHQRKLRGFHPDAMKALVNHAWPGNVRELENAVEHAVILETGELVSREALPPEIGSASGDPWSTPAVPDITSGENKTLREHTEMFEKTLIRNALEQSGGVKKNAAKILGISPRILSYYLKKYELA